MTIVQLEESILFLLSFLLLSILLGMIIAWGWAFQRLGKGESLLPQVPIRSLPKAHWGAGTVLLVIVLYLGANLAVGVAHSLITGPSGAGEAKDHAAAKAAPERPEADEASKKPRSRSALEIILLTCAANLVFCVLAVPLLRRLSNVGPSDLGLFRDHWPRQVRFGVVAALLATPATYAIQFVAINIWRVSEHPVQKMMTDQLTPRVTALAFLSTVILAPLVEETMFRGILQRWLTRLFGSEHRVIPPPRPSLPIPPAEADNPSSSETSVEPKPELLSLEIPETTSGDSGAPRAILATSILFAAMHGAQWPDPVALFVFSLVLGTIYQKTGSLLTSMVAHGAFNGCSTLFLLVQQLARHLRDASAPAVTSAIQAALKWVTTLA